MGTAQGATLRSSSEECQLKNVYGFPDSQKKKMQTETKWFCKGM